MTTGMMPQSTFDDMLVDWTDYDKDGSKHGIQDLQVACPIDEDMLHFVLEPTTTSPVI